VSTVSFLNVGTILPFLVFNNDFLFMHQFDMYESDRHGSCPTKPNLTAPEMPKLSNSFPVEHSVSNTFRRPLTLEEIN